LKFLLQVNGGIEDVAIADDQFSAEQFLANSEKDMGEMEKEQDAGIGLGKGSAETALTHPPAPSLSQDWEREGVRSGEAGSFD
jgi:hypothetical protein